MTPFGDDLRTSLIAAQRRGDRRVRELTEQLAAIVEASDGANLDDEHDPEGATVGFERAQISALLEQARSQLEEIIAALHRVDLGTYGVCERCRREIPAARLEAQPATRTCVSCAAHRH